MRIKTLIKLSIAVTLLMTLVLAVADWVVINNLTEIHRSQELAQSASQAVSRLLVLTHEYALHSEERTVQQWQFQHASLALMLEDNRKNLIPAPVESITEAKLLREIFQQLLSSASSPDDLRQRQKALLLNQFLASAQLLTDRVNRWNEENNSLHLKFQNIFSVITNVSVVMMLLMLVFLTLILVKKVMKPLDKVHKAVLAVAQGNLSVHCAIGTDDELGDLSRAFDAMAIDLVTELRNEIAEKQKYADLSKIAEESRKQREDINSAQLRLVQFSLTHTYKELMEEALNEAEKLTGSLIGFFHFVDDDQNSLILQGWSTRTKNEFCKAEGEDSHYEIEKAGVWVDCVHQRQPVVHNDYASLPHRKGMPEGHAVIVRELAIPVIRGDRLMAIIGVGNKPVDYNEMDIENLVLLADLVWEIVDRMRGEANILSSEEKFSKAFNNAPVMMSISTMDEGIFLDMNRKFFETTGFTKEELIGRTSLETGIISPEDRLHAIQKLQQDGNIKGMELTYRSKDGKEIFTQYYGEIIQVDGKPCILSILLDITDFLHIQYTNNKLEEQIAQTQRIESIGRLAGGIAHDFNNKLMVILGYAQLGLSDNKDTKHIAGYLHEITKAAQLSSQITGQLLAFSRQQIIAPKKIDANQVIAEVKKSLSRLIGEHISLTFSPGGNLWNILIDPVQLDQIVMNMAVNARDAMSDGGIFHISTMNVLLSENECKKIQSAVPGEYVAIEFKDTGTGMDQATLQHIFEPFFTTKELGKGTGLGLATIHGITFQNNGFIDVKSTLGYGTVFTIYFPKYNDELPTDEAATDNYLEAPSEAGSVLLVEDEPMLLEFTRHYLCKQGYTVYAADLPSKALEIVDDGSLQLDLVLTDVIMPEMNGVDLVKRIKKERPGIKSVFVSGHVADHDVLDDLVNESNFLQKPYDLDKMSMLLRKLLADNLITGCRILVIDDDLQVLRQMELCLQKEGYKVVTAENGEEGIRISAQNNFDLIITDILMPRMGGYEVIKHFKGRPDCPRIIAMSGGTAVINDKKLLKLASYKVDMVLAKPVRYESLMDAVRTVMLDKSTHT